MDRINIRAGQYNSYKAFSDWCGKYYPDMSTLIPHYTENTFKHEKQKAAKKLLEEYKTTWYRLSPDDTLETAVAHLVDDEGFTRDEAILYAKEAQANAKKSLSVVILETTIPIYPTTADSRKLLKWRCPIKFVRNFLYANWNLHECFIYRWFFKGKKEFGQ